MVNTTALNNMSQFKLNNTLVNASQDITTNVVTNANNGSDGYIGLIIMLLIYFWLTYILMNKQGLFQFDFVKGNVISTGVVVILGFVMLAGDLIASFQHVMWFVIAFSFLVISSYFLKKKGL